MRVSKRMRLIARVLGYKCCVTCKFFNSKFRECEHPKVGRNFPAFFFDLRHSRENRKPTLFEEAISIGCACSFWEGLKVEDLKRRKKK